MLVGHDLTDTRKGAITETVDVRFFKAKPLHQLLRRPMAVAVDVIALDYLPLGGGEALFSNKTYLYKA